MIDFASLERAWRESIRNPHTARQYWQTLHKFQDFLNSKNIEVLTATTEDIRDWIVKLEKDQSVKTANNYLSGLRNFYKFAKGSGAIDTDPTNGIEHKSEGKVFQAFCQDAESLALIRKLIRCAEADPKVMRQVEEFVASLKDPRRPQKSYDLRGVDRKLMASAKMALAHVVVCSYCGLTGTEREGPDGNVWTIDHVVPISQGGVDDLGNLVKSCKSCNSRKSAKKWWPRPCSTTAAGTLWSPPMGT
jgi:hypothetical protein